MSFENEPKHRSIFEIVTSMIHDANAKVFQNMQKLNSYIVDRFSFADYKMLFRQKNETMFTPQLRQAAESKLNARIPDLLLQRGHEKTQITFLPVNFDLRGKPIDFTKSYDESNVVPPYLIMAISTPSDATGLCYVQGWFKPMPLLKLIPTEIEKACSLIFDPEKYLRNPNYLQADLDRIFQDLPGLIG